MVAELVLLGVVVVAAGAELLHRKRCLRIARLAFGPGGKPARWARAIPLLRVAALGAMSWGLVSLMLLTPKVHKIEAAEEQRNRHVLLLLDVSPSMRLQDAGVEHDQSRMARASDVMESFFRRVAIQQYRLSVVAFYTGAKPVVKETKDLEVVRNILNDLPMHYAFNSGETDLFGGLRESVEIARKFPPRSTTLLVVTDGDTVPSVGIPKMPASVKDVVIVGVGDPIAGEFIDGRQSRQDISTLRQVAARLGGTFHNGNEKHLPTDLLNQLTKSTAKSQFEQLTRREYALLACAIGALLYAFLPVLLHFWGTRWRPGPSLLRESGKNDARRFGIVGGMNPPRSYNSQRVL